MLADAEIWDEIKPAMKSINIDLATPSLFCRLLEQEGGLLIGESNFKKAWLQLPASCRGVLPESNFALISLFVKGKPIGVLCAGGFASDPKKAQARFSQLRKICTATGQALANNSR